MFPMPAVVLLASTGLVADDKVALRRGLSMGASSGACSGIGGGTWGNVWDGCCRCAGRNAGSEVPLLRPSLLLLDVCALTLDSPFRCAKSEDTWEWG